MAGAYRKPRAGRTGTACAAAGKCAAGRRGGLCLWRRRRGGDRSRTPARLRRRRDDDVSPSSGRRSSCRRRHRRHRRWLAGDGEVINLLSRRNLMFRVVKAPALRFESTSTGDEGVSAGGSGQPERVRAEDSASADGRRAVAAPLRQRSRDRPLHRRGKRRGPPAPAELRRPRHRGLTRPRPRRSTAGARHTSSVRARVALDEFAVDGRRSDASSRSRAMTTYAVVDLRRDPPTELAGVDLRPRAADVAPS